MNLSRDQLAAILERPGMRQANPDLGAVAPQKHQPQARPALVKDLPGGQSSESGVAVSVDVIALRNAYCDEDNSRAGYKPLQDAIAASLGIDDGASRIRFNYGQIVTDGAEGTIVRIQWHS